MPTDDHWMRLAIDKAREGIAQGQTPFGACIVKEDQPVAIAHNQVWQTTDITAHAEIQALRHACHALNTIDLAGCTLYSTCEPCPMCFSACHWARLARIAYGATITDAQHAGFNELRISNHDLKQLSRSPLQITPALLQAECAALFQQWLSQPHRRVY